MTRIPSIGELVTHRHVPDVILQVVRGNSYDSVMVIRVAGAPDNIGRNYPDRTWMAAIANLSAHLPASMLFPEGV